MTSHDLYERLTSIGISPEYYRNWTELVVRADDKMRSELLTALEGASEAKQYVIIALSCEGPDKARGFGGVGGWLNEEAEQFIRYIIATAEVTARVYEAKHGNGWEQWDRETFVMMVRYCYRTVEAADKPLTEELVSLSKATLVCCAAHGPSTGFNETASYFAGHFDALEPYIEFLIRSEDTTHSQLNMLLATQPVVPLTRGIL